MPCYSFKQVRQFFSLRKRPGIPEAHPHNPPRKLHVVASGTSPPRFKSSLTRISEKLTIEESPPSQDNLCSHQGKLAREATPISNRPAAGFKELKVPSARSVAQRSNCELSNCDHGSTTESERGGHATNRTKSNKTSISTVDSESRQTLQYQLGNARIEWPLGSYRYFYPADELERLITYDSILIELKRCNVQFPTEALPRLAAQIFKSVPKLFAILVCLEQAHLIHEFLEEEIDDTHLPFVRSDINTSEGVKLCSGKNTDKQIQCMASWSSHRISEFGQLQWYMRAPVFEFGEEIKHYELHDNDVLPWIEDHKRKNHAAEGGYGSVWRIKIHPAHQQIHNNPHSENPHPYLALKKLHSNNKQSFDSEVEMLKTLKRKQHPHLVQLLATFQYKGEFYMIFPFANLNLREYWQSTPLSDFSHETVLWVLCQMKAIASGLNMVHEYRSTGDETEARSFQEHKRAGGCSQGAEENDRRYGRHGDIKAENILWFVDEAVHGSDNRGLLVIADFGLTDFHKLATRSEVRAELVTGSPTYEPPELKLHSKISRAYDIWSLGCLYLEFITWLVCGCDDLNRFPEARGKTSLRPINDDTFFTIIGEDAPGARPFAVVREGVQAWMKDLLEMPRCSELVHDFVALISKHMLVVDPKKRIKSGPLNRELERMQKKVDKNPDYLTKPYPLKARTQQPHPTSLAASPNFDRSPLGPADGTSLPRRQSTFTGLNSTLSRPPPGIPPRVFTKFSRTNSLRLW